MIPQNIQRGREESWQVWLKYVAHRRVEFKNFGAERRDLVLGS